MPPMARPLSNGDGMAAPPFEKRDPDGLLRFAALDGLQHALEAGGQAHGQLALHAPQLLAQVALLEEPPAAGLEEGRPFPGPELGHGMAHVDAPPLEKPL